MDASSLIIPCCFLCNHRYPKREFVILSKCNQLASAFGQNGLNDIVCLALRQLDIVLSKKQFLQDGVHLFRSAVWVACFTLHHWFQIVLTSHCYSIVLPLRLITNVGSRFFILSIITWQYFGSSSIPKHLRLSWCDATIVDPLPRNKSKIKFPAL